MALPEFNPAKILRDLVAHDVDFVLIGGLAAISHGSPYLTQDVDITPSVTMGNLAKLSAALTDLEARIRTEGVDGGLPFGHDAESLAATSVWNLTTPYGDLDISLQPSGTEGFPDLARQATAVDAFGVTIKIAALADIIRSKQAADREKDRLVLPVLREILSRRLDEK
ncbi:MAG: hypothetical protein WKF79_12740 [Nocardioides sp.]